MARLTIYKETDMDTTVVSNLFIDEYMGDANDAQLKVYLYLLRMMNARLSTSVSDIADKFNHTEKEVLRALKYWEKHQLLDLDFDEDKTLVGIHIRELDTLEKKRRKDSGSSFIPMPRSADRQAEDYSARQTASVPTLQPVPDTVAQEEPAAEVNPFAKPFYNADQLREFKNRESTAQLLFIAETYIGKPLTPSEMKAILYFTDVLHFSEDLIDYLLQYCIDKGKKDFKYIEKVAVSWAESGVTTPEEAQKSSYLYDKIYYSVMKALGKQSSPTPKEAEYITRWTKEYCFDNDIIFEACERTVMATDRNRFEYTERILKSWFQQNVHHKEDIARIDEQFKSRKKPGSGAGTGSSPRGGGFNQFSQNPYDFDALEQELLSN